MNSKHIFFKKVKPVSVFSLQTPQIIKTTREVREHLEVADTFPIHKKTCRVDYMSSVGIDYDQAVKYIDVVESMNRSFYKNDINFWKIFPIFFYGFTIFFKNKFI